MIAHTSKLMIVRAKKFLVNDIYNKTIYLSYIMVEVLGVTEGLTKSRATTLYQLCISLNRFERVKSGNTSLADAPRSLVNTGVAMFAICHITTWRLIVTLGNKHECSNPDQ